MWKLRLKEYINEIFLAVYLVKFHLECGGHLQNTLLYEAALGVVEVGELGGYADHEHHAVQHLPSLKI